MRALPFLTLLFAAPAQAQYFEPVTEVWADLDADGVSESYVIRDGGELVVTEGDWQRVLPDAASVGPLAGQKPTLAINEAGSVLLTAMQEGMGRDRWSLTLTIAHRDGDWRIAGYTYDFYDTLDTSVWGHCDLNMLTGEGFAETEDGPLRPVAPAAPLLWDWRASELPLPMGPICFDGWVVR